MLFPEGPEDPSARSAEIEWKFTREQVEGMTAFAAKRAGDGARANMKKLGIDWVSFEGRRFPYWTSEKGEHYRIIREAMAAKLAQNENVREVLRATRGLRLRPDHHQEPDAPPAWHYHEIWMELREELP